MDLKICQKCTTDPKCHFLVKFKIVKLYPYSTAFCLWNDRRLWEIFLIKESSSKVRINLKQGIFEMST